MPFLSEATTAQPPTGEIDYRLARRQLLSEFRKGRLAQHEICDAQPELVRVAREASSPTSVACPVCDDGLLVHVTFVFGPRLPKHGRCVTSLKELKALARQSGDFSVYVVEVCPECRWNHLARSFPLKPRR
ncbi:MAG: DUF5318 family protein [Acidimicrobiales bacterium]|nr:DUF5318 family protein [Acidimicrobiales bacterium]MCB1250862.1 DUF5318 family protein [Acidimicrobiales bacterium]MCB1260571.1 DUF5318 family protein [Acidimicrobiales bacterium]